MSAFHNLSELFVQTLEQAIDGVVVIDRKNRVVLFNKAAESLWGLPREEVIGRNVQLLVPEAIRPHHDAYIDANRRTGVNRIVGTSREVPIRHSDGSQRWGSMSISRVETAGESFYTAFIKDVTTQHEERERLKLLSLVADQTDSAIIVTDAQWRIAYVNPGFSRMFGYSSEDVMQRNPTQFLAPYLDTANVERRRTHLARGFPEHTEELAYGRDGQRIWCSVTANPVLDEQGRLLQVVCVLADITQAKMHEVLQYKMLEAMAREEPLEELMLLACHEVERIAPDVIASILRVDEQGLLRPLAAPSLPLRYSQALDGVPIGPGVGTCGTAAFEGRPVLSRDIDTDPNWEGFRHLARDCGLKSCWSSPIKSSTDRVLGTFAFYYRDNRTPSALHRRLIDLSVHLCALALERDETRSRISRLASYDSLTGLPNRSLLLTRADLAIARAVEDDTPLAVLFIDLDRFKQVNDSLGPLAGDSLLRLIAERLNLNRQPGDIVGRLSGDEFVLLLPNCGSDQVGELIEQLSSTLSAPCQIDDMPLTPSVSIGISLFPEDGQDMGTLIHCADMAMYQAKHSGRGRVSFFSPELNHQAQERLALEAALRNALDQEQLHLHYQPQVDLRDGSLYGVEALARWRHPQFGEIPPGRFIPLAEDCGLLDELGKWVLHTACTQLATWRSAGFAVPVVSVNLSPTSFHDTALPALIMHHLARNGLQASDLTLEITENVLMDATAETLATIDAIHRLGVRLAMDDFGTGYSSLSYLRRLPLQELKLDRSFVHDLEHDATCRALSEAVMRIGESLHMTVVAEGIETHAQWRILKDQGYHVAQGFLLARPLPPDELQAWMRDRPRQGPGRDTLNAPASTEP